jgi:hypothetical protein
VTNTLAYCDTALITTVANFHCNGSWLRTLLLGHFKAIKTGCFESGHKTFVEMVIKISDSFFVNSILPIKLHYFNGEGEGVEGLDLKFPVNGYLLMNPDKR